MMGIRCENGIIAEARFRTFNCISAIAAADWVCEQLQGLPLERAPDLSVDAIDSALDGLPSTRLFCAHLVADAIRAALAEARQKGF